MQKTWDQESQGGLFDNNHLWIYSSFSLKRQAWDQGGFACFGNCGKSLTIPIGLQISAAREAKSAFFGFILLNVTYR